MTPITRSITAVDTYVAQRLRAARKDLGLAQERAAEHLNLTFQQVQKYELGRNRITAGKLANAVMTWQPIETAPKDGTPVDLWCVPPGISTGPGRVTDCWFAYGEWRQYSEIEPGNYLVVHNATHWMPLPEPPVTP